MISLSPFDKKVLPRHRETILDPFLNVLKNKYIKNCESPVNIYYLFLFPPICPLLLYRHRKEKAINESTTGKTVSRHKL